MEAVLGYSHVVESEVGSDSNVGSTPEFDVTKFWNGLWILHRFDA